MSWSHRGLMFQTSKLLWNSYRFAPCRSEVKCCRFANVRSPKGRAAFALTELVLVVYVPCFCLGAWALCDSEIKTSLLAPLNQGNQLTWNVVYDAVKMEDETVLTVQGSGQLRYWDLKNSVNLGELQSRLSEVRCAGYSPEQRLLAVGSAMGELEVWDLEHPEMPLVTVGNLQSEVAACQFTPGGQALLTCGEGELGIWNPRTLERLDRLASPVSKASFRSLAISTDGKLVICGNSSGLVQVWDLEQRQLVRTHRVDTQFNHPEAAVEAVSFIGDGTNFIAATRNSGVAIWNVDTGVCVQRFIGYLPGLRSGVLSADESRFVAGHADGQIVTWEVATGSRIGPPLKSNSLVRTLECSADGQLLLSGNSGGQVQFQHESNRLVTSEITHQ